MAAAAAKEKEPEGNKTMALISAPSEFVPRKLKPDKLWAVMAPLIDAHCGLITEHTHIRVTVTMFFLTPKHKPRSPLKRVVQGLVFTKTPMSSRDAILAFRNVTDFSPLVQTLSVLEGRWVVHLEVNHFQSDSEAPDSAGSVACIERGKTFVEAFKTAGLMGPDGITDLPAASAAAAGPGAAASS